MKYQLEVKRRTRWVALPGVYTRLASLPLLAVASNLKTGAKVRVRRSDGYVGPTYTVHRDPGLRRKTDDNGWRKP